ncbi:hypothetical protein SPRG_04980 [Saprolegnia parasitica CBS 223.65]|uniref:Uncharacterized protein n=1 Tax=Saprolegnia parasitica (strain CBS 223.65) TaxID=695850 RepID=A0A067CGM7_SAPPC|nr:hypothetical protein SPRG_04980 [Saprolegnia parasitica CBS 223.65]KDO29914.1 hypothetical protein SPRG_04980 [Saprolegnia parasitica CBS 223.65]|eukprot:XP_012199508.1 hypothetical protein SPRG_04980 [Saprolegnia parasitica CBS 223.65]
MHERTTLPGLGHAQSLPHLADAQKELPNSQSALGLVSPPKKLKKKRTLAPLPPPVSRPTSPAKLLSMRLDTSQDSAFQALLSATHEHLAAGDVDEATKRTLDLLQHVENKHYASLHLRQAHVTALQEVERALEQLEHDAGTRRQAQRHAANESMHALSALLLAPSTFELSPARALMASVAGAYKHAGDTRAECIGAFEHLLLGNHGLSAAQDAFEAGDIDRALALASDATASYARYQASAHFAPCQLLLSLGSRDVAWSHDAHEEVYRVLDQRLALAAEAAFVQRGLVILSASLEASKSSLAANDPDCALDHLRRCERYRLWLGDRASLSASIVASLEKKYTKAKLLLPLTRLETLNEFELSRVIALWSSVAKDVETATMLVAEGAIAKLTTTAVMVAPKPSLFASLMQLWAAILTASAASDQVFVAEALRWLLEVLTHAASSQDKRLCLRYLVQWMTARPLLHHVVGKGRFLTVWGRDRDANLGDVDLMAAYVQVWQHFLSLHAKCLHDDPRSLPLLTAIWTRHVAKLDVATLCLDVATTCFRSGLAPSRAVDANVVGAITTMLQVHNKLHGSVLQHIVTLLQVLLPAEKKCLAKARAQRDVLLPRLIGLDGVIPLYDLIAATDSASTRNVLAVGSS